MSLLACCPLELIMCQLSPPVLFWVCSWDCFWVCSCISLFVSARAHHFSCICSCTFIFGCLEKYWWYVTLFYVLFVWFSNRDFGPRVFLVGWSAFLAGWNFRWLVGVFLFGWQEFLAGWKDSLTGWLESCPGWMKFLPGWLDSKVWAVWSEVWGARCELWGVRRVVWCVRLLNGSGVAGGHNFLLFEWVRKNAIRFCFVLHIPLV